MAGELQLGGSTVATHTGSGASAVVTIDNGVKFPAGNAINVASVVRTDATFGTNSATPQTALTLNYTPKTTSSKILVIFNLMIGSAGSSHTKVAMFRDSTEIFKGDNEGNRIGHAAYTYQPDTGESQFIGSTFLDSPSTNAQVTYTARLGSNGSVIIYLNRTARDDNYANYDGRYASSLTLIEFA